MPIRSLHDLSLRGTILIRIAPTFRLAANVLPDTDTLVNVMSVMAEAIPHAVQTEL